jgi:hypothetical protein
MSTVADRSDYLGSETWFRGSSLALLAPQPPTTADDLRLGWDGA